MRPPPLPRPLAHALRPALIALAVAVPALVASGLVYALFGTHLGRFRPYLTDEFNYWHQIATFAAHGWNGGYYTVEEHPAPAAFTRFGAHGPAFPVLYGLVAKLVGWRVWSPPVFNAVVLAAAVGVFVRVGRPDTGRLGLTVLTLALFWPLHTYLPTNMQEAVHQALAIVLAAVLARLIAQGEGAPVSLRVWAVALPAAATVMRPTWVAVLVPAAVLAFGLPRPRRTAWVLAVTLVAGVGLGALYPYLAAPWPRSVLYTFSAARAADVGRAWGELAGLFFDNVVNVFRIHFSNPLQLLTTAQRYAVVFLALFSLVRLARAAYARRRGAEVDGADVAFHLLHAVSLVGILLLCALLLPMHGFPDYRHVAPILLLSLMVYVLAARRWVPLVYAGASAALVVVFLQHYRPYHLPHFAYDRSPAYDAAARAAYQRNVADRVAYDPAGGPWDNTLLVDVPNYNSHLVAIAPGVGISRVFDWRRVDFPLRSRYVLIVPLAAERLRGRARLRPVSAGPFGLLYLNLDNPAVAARADGPSGTASPP